MTQVFLREGEGSSLLELLLGKFYSGHFAVCLCLALLAFHVSHPNNSECEWVCQLDRCVIPIGMVSVGWVDMQLPCGQVGICQDEEEQTAHHWYNP